MKGCLHSPQFGRESLARNNGIFLLCCQLCLLPCGCKTDVWAAETNAAHLLSDPKLFYDLSRTNPAMLQAIVEEGKRKYEQALVDGRLTIPYAREFSELFTNRQEIISYYSGQAGPQTWNSKAGLYGRYLLSMQMRIKIDQTGTNIVSFDSPSFSLQEITRIRTSPKDPSPGGQLLVDGAPESARRFGAAEWQKLVKSKGDLSVLGIQVDTNHPVGGFEVNWKRF